MEATITYEIAAEICRAWERLNNITSEDFVERYKAGEYLGVRDAVRWVSMIETRDRLKAEAMAIEATATPRQLIKA